MGGVTAKYQPQFLSSSKILFARKMEFAKMLEYEKGVRTAIIELANCLSSHVVQLAAYFPNERESNIRALEEEMKDDIYSSFGLLSNDNYFIDGNLNTLCMKRDARRAYELAEEECKTFKFRCRFFVKRIASILLKHIQM